ncbi:pectate lyase family protein [Allosphingosinicella deserti]|uniref:pectate lyase family protein n=1 Tax=Allosphingosinicella deserti TaxID=2116704 RepID=UPI001E64161B|nr:pectate lyase [Sphingomonas deserti]
MICSARPQFQAPGLRRGSALLAGVLALLPSCSGRTEAAPPPQPTPVSGELAFPSAVGHGATSRGGRGGRILYVDTLEDNGPASLRSCIEASGPRTCVFRVSGTIRFHGPSPAIKQPYLTIAGQTAPGGGITIANSSDGAGRTPIIVKDTHDVVIRHVRVRLDTFGPDPAGEDAFTIENSRNVILDHVSGSWARDELVNPYGDNDRITISSSLFAEGIPPHDKCALLGSDPQGPQNLSFIGNLCAHSGDRNPDINFAPGSCVEVVNNVFYNANSQFAEVWESYGGTPVAITGNYFRGGPNTARKAVGIDRELIGSKGISRVYLWDNHFDGAFVHMSPLLPAATIDKPTCSPTVRTMPSGQAYERVLKEAGALPRDAFDAGVLSDVRTRRGRIKTRPGTIPAAAAAPPYRDDDRDGMDDEWERRMQIDPQRHDPWGDADHDGNYNFDEFLDHLHRRLTASAAADAATTLQGGQ